MSRSSAFAALLCLVLCSPVLAQEPATATRAELLEQMREQKAKVLEPYKPRGIEKALLYIEKHRVLERFSVADGWYPRFGGLTTGGGFGFGAGYRRHLMNDHLFLDGSGAISMKAYKDVVGSAATTFWNNRLEVGGKLQWRDFPQEDFFGIGPDSLEDQRTNFALESTDISGGVTFRPIPWLRFGTQFGRLDPTITSGTDSRYPSTETVFPEAEAPGLTAQPAFFYRNLFVEVDRRDQPGNPRSGGVVRANYGAWDDRELNEFDFGRFDGEAAYFFPIFDKKRVIAVRMMLSFVNNVPGNQVPFYFLPYAGGSDSLRGFQEFRFRDENMIFLNAEYRWEAFAGLDMAVFFDRGEVSSDWEDIDLRDARSSYGIGFRFNTYKNVFMRLDIGVGGREGTQIFFKMGPAF